MTGLHVCHLLYLSLWGGLVAGESVMEIYGRKHPEFQQAVARFHLWMDLCVEIPLLVAVLMTGGLLLQQRALDTQLLIKVLAGMGALAANIYCVTVVIRRTRTLADEDLTRRLSGKVILSAVTGVPLALVALFLGALRMGWVNWA